MLYFAYGSNLDEDQMRKRCPHATAEHRARLREHELAFGGSSKTRGGAVANVLQSFGHEVPGLLYTIDEADLERLDRFEGAPTTYQRVERVVLDEHGKERRAQVYLKYEVDFERGAPSSAYLEVMKRAYARLSFDDTELLKAANP